jgi:hypothetical protein
MPVIIVGTEKNFTALRPRLVAGRVSPAAAGEIAAAVQAANPHVDLKALRPGTILTVPDLPKVSVAGDVSLDDRSRQAIADISATAGTTLDGVAAAAKARERDAAAARRQLAKSLEADELDVAARRDKLLASDLKAARDAVAAADDRAKERAAAFDRARADWTAELKALTSLLPGSA